MKEQSLNELLDTLDKRFIPVEFFERLIRILDTQSDLVTNLSLGRLTKDIEEWKRN